MRGSTKKQKGRIGSSFDDFLKEEGIYEGVTARAIKRVIARQLDALMQEQGISKTELARSMKTSRAQLDRVRDAWHAHARRTGGGAQFADGIGVTLDRIKACEHIFETYYAFALNKQITLTADYQFITNPACNADRGPVPVFSERFHGEF
jgi:hypothetical protein